MRKKPIALARSIPGFIGNRLQYAMLREAEYLLQHGIAGKEDIDAAVTYSIGRRYAVTGRLESADMGGLDVFHAVSSHLYPDLAVQRQPLQTMNDLVEKGHYGIKSGKGFYEWSESRANHIRQSREDFLIQRLLEDRLAEHRQDE
ncbi:3-hydroxyacyl-CoA dehydrogenase family protein [Paenibacillus cymbidii]|uniref:3-hydroxyacyl-CoA dehydrogenase family protein n=1 Tax=Paenibacillus cymbidii TaxID=1639034 RepID=UPI0022A84E3D|nr:3-hydroxyacyl-CoA dehydrogenase family protein [Paenibacillus cymbidii]